MAENNTETTTNGSGQTVSIIIPEKGIGWVVFAIFMLIAFLIWADHRSNEAELKANQAIKTSEDAQTELRITQLWAQRVSLSCQQAGVKTPALPASMVN